MNKKNIIMLSIAAMLFANCAVGMEKKDKLVKIKYDPDSKQEFTEKLKNVPVYSSIKGTFCYKHNWSYKEFVEKLNLFFKKLNEHHLRLRCLTIKTIHGSWLPPALEEKEQSLEKVNWKDAPALKKLNLEHYEHICRQSGFLSELYYSKVRHHGINLEDIKDCLEILCLRNTTLSTEMINVLIKNNPYLRILDLSKCKNASLNDIKLENAKNLLAFDASDTDISTETVNKIIGRLQVLRLQGCQKIDCEKINWEKARDLKLLDIESNPLTEKQLVKIINTIPALKHIYFSINSYPDEFYIREAEKMYNSRIIHQEEVKKIFFKYITIKNVNFDAITNKDCKLSWNPPYHCPPYDENVVNPPYSCIEREFNFVNQKD